MNSVWKVYKIFNYIKFAGAIFSGISIVAMMLFIVYDVIGRNFLFGSIRGGFEIVQNYFMPLAVFPALAYVYTTGVLPRMNLLVSKSGEHLQKIIIFALLALELFVLSFVVYFSWNYAVGGMERGMAFPAGGSMYPLYPFLFLVPLGFAMIIVENIFILLKNIEEKKATLLVHND
ncbi:TRAP transporter small permease [Alteribacillus sp. JSM 102045]|uniref:TRAP transporter small permease n=1 Tax=Alteribacillus sp. JSM 102045 TaxID=1562101 RepID=UPI0035C04D04